MSRNITAGNGGNLAVVDHLLASGEMLAAQLPHPSNWSPQKRLAGAVLMSALVEVRDRHSDPAYRRRVAEDLEWILSDDVEWPFSFVRLCELFGLEPVWVRQVVATWMRHPTRTQHRQAIYCYAA